MAAKANKKRYWKMRSGMLSLSILSVLPILAVMRAGSTATPSTAANGQLATISPQAASGGTASTQSQTVSSQSSTTTHTRTAVS
jgi:hypothetical protein